MKRHRGEAGNSVVAANLAVARRASRGGGLVGDIGGSIQQFTYYCCGITAGRQAERKRQRRGILLSPAEATAAGFSDPNVLLIAALFVIGDGLVRTGIALSVGE